MKQLILLFLLSLCFSLEMVIAVGTTPLLKEEIKEEVTPSNLTKKEQRKQAKIKKRMQKIEKKLAKKGYHVNNSIWDNDTFRLGALAALGGLLILLLGFIPIIGGVLKIIGLLVLIAGIGVMIWALIENP